MKSLKTKVKNENTITSIQIKNKDTIRCTKDIQNDSNYTKNLLKGFRRFMNQKLRKNQEALEKFQNFFYNNALSNELILMLLNNNSQFSQEFDLFLSLEPTQWIADAKIKDVEK